MSKVFIVGAGIGGSEYLTLKAHKIITSAEILIYDALVDPRLLELVLPNCRLVCVGKRGGQDSISQTEINQLLVQECLNANQPENPQIIVRLKSGDPMIFGRTVSEIAALAAANCEYEIIPGISAAIAAPMLAGIPLTDAEISPCFAVLTGHEIAALPWSGLAQMPTLVILMGTANLPSLLEKLIFAKNAETPIAIMQWAGRANQQIWTGTLKNILSKLPERISPSVIVVGEVVRHHDWIYQAPKKLALTGKRILVTRATGTSGEFRQLLETAGAEVIEMPTLVILPPDSWEALDRAIAHIQDYDWLIFTSANAVDFFFQRLRAQNRDSRSLHHLKIAVVGRKTAEFLAQHGIIADLVPRDFIADALAADFPACAGSKILFPRVQSGGRDILISELEQKGAIITAIAAYESGCPPKIDAMALSALQNQHVDILTFASSKTVKHFCQLLNQVAPPETWANWLSLVKIASIGTQTSASCRELLGRVDIEANEFTITGLAEAICLT